MSTGLSEARRHRELTAGTSALSTNARSIDATTVLITFFMLTMIIPAGSVVAQLGQLGAPSTIFAVCILIWWVWDLLHRRRSGEPFTQPVRRVAIILMVVAILVYRHAALGPMDPAEITPSDSGLIKFLALMGIVVVASDGIPSLDRWHLLQKRMAHAAIAVAALSLLQYFTKQLWIDLVPLPGLTSPSVDSLGSRSGLARSSGTSVHPIEFAAVMSMMLPLVITQARFTTRGRFMAWAGVGVVGLAVLFSVSRTALACAAMAMLVLLAAWPRRHRMYGLLGGIGLLTGASLVAPGLLSTLQSLVLGAADDPSVDSRTAGYAYAQEMFSYNPWLGRGLGTFIPKYYIFDNGYLQLTMETGVFGLVSFMALLVSASACALWAAKGFSQTHDKQAVYSILAGIVAGSTSIAFFDLFAFPQSAACLVLLVGLSGSAYRMAHANSMHTQDPNLSV